MSKQADELLKQLLNEQSEIEWEEATQRVSETCGVKESTAGTYIHESPNTNVQIDSDGSKKVLSPSENTGETVLHEEDEIMEMEVGEPSGKKFGELEVLEDVGHPDVPEEHESGYFRRRMGDGDTPLSKKTDVQVVTASIDDDDFSTLLIGKHGIGKDKLLLHIAANTNRPVIRLTANDDPDFVDLLIGTYQPDEDGNFQRQKGLLQVAIENGYMFIIDEFNNLSGKVQTMLNLILESSDQQQMTIPETNEQIKPHPEFKFIATQNPNKVGYGDREDLDQSTASRFFPIDLPPLQTDAEQEVIAQETEWESDDEALKTLLREDGGVVSGIRAMHDMGKVSMWVSTRDVIQIGRMAEKIGSAEAAAEMILTGRAGPEDIDPIRSAIRDNNWPN